MEEILALQAQLAAVQKASTKQRLAERNVVELVLKLKLMGKIELVYTLDGKEFLTPAQLERDIQDELRSNAGRAELGLIQPILNVGMEAIEAAAQSLVAKTPDVELIGGELVAEYYLDELAEELNEDLQMMGQTTIGEIASKVNLPVETVKKMLTRGLTAGRVAGTLQASTLYTDAFVARERARIRGAFSAVTMPTSVHAVRKLQDLTDGAMVDGAVQALIAGGEVAGAMKSGGQYVPRAFAATQASELEAFFKQNGYITHARAAKLEVPDAAAALRPAHADLIALGESVVSAGLLAQLEGTVEEVALSSTEVKKARKSSWAKGAGSARED